MTISRRLLLVLSRYLVDSASALGLEVIDRCNLTVLLEPGQEHLAQYLADHQVHCTLQRLSGSAAAAAAAATAAAHHARLVNGGCLLIQKWPVFSYFCWQYIHSLVV